jgi:3',5'-cyclic AMP phosphodiesterase CpdA
VSRRNNGQALVARLAFALVLAAAFGAAGCGPPAARGPVTFAVISNILATDGGSEVPMAASATALGRLGRTIQEINESKDVAFVVLDGNLLGRGQAGALEQVRSALGELKKPYYVVLGPEAENEKLKIKNEKLETSEETSATTEKATTETATTASPSSAGGLINNKAAGTVGTTVLTWTFSGHGLGGSAPYWSATASGGLALVGLYSAAAGPGRPGHIDAAQLAWLDRTLTERSGEAVIIFSYHSLVSFHPLDNTVAWQDRLVDNREEVLEVLRRHGNVLLAVSASHGFAEGQTVGGVVQASVAALSIWPLAYEAVRVTPGTVEYQYIPVGTDDETRAAFDRLVEDPGVQAVFGTGERSEQQVLQIFAGRKISEWNLKTLRP